LLARSSLASWMFQRLYWCCSCFRAALVISVHRNFQEVS
jgi:hypothetical protein